MSPPSGEAPVYLHDIMHAMQTAIGARPRPAGGDQMRGVPVVVNLGGDGPDVPGEDTKFVAVQVPCDAWRFFPHLSAQTDPEKGPLSPERAAKFMLVAKLPPGYRIVRDAPQAAPDYNCVSAGGPDDASAAYATLAQVTAGAPPFTPPPTDAIPELAHLPPDVLRTNTDRPAGFTGKRDSVPNAGDQGG